MMKRFTLSLLAFAFSLIGCKDDDVAVPLPSTIENLVAVPGSGCVTFHWDVPADSNMLYVRVSYVNPETNEMRATLVSRFCDSVVVDDLLNRYGVIPFSFQMFNERETPGQVQTIEAQAEAAERVTVLNGRDEPVALTVEMIYTNAQEAGEGSLAKLVDGTVASNNFFHSSWSGTCVDKSGRRFSDPGPPHYLVLDLGREVYACSFAYATRNAGDVPHTLKVYGSASFDYSNWQSSSEEGGSINTVYSPDDEDGVLFSTLTGMVSTATSWFTSAPFVSETPFRYLWLSHTGRAYFALSEIKATTLGVNVFDPETGETSEK